MEKPNLHKRVVYERTESGVDVYLLKTGVPDVVECLMAFPMGTLRAADNDARAKLHAFLMPSGTATMTRPVVRTTLDALGADVSVRMTDRYLEVRIRALASAFGPAFALVMDMITAPRHTAKEFAEAKAQYDAGLREKNEDTSLRAWEALAQAHFSAGHPLYVEHATVTRKKLTNTTLRDAMAFYQDTLSAVGAIVVLAGDIEPGRHLKMLNHACTTLPHTAPKRPHMADLGATHAPNADTYIVTLRDKMNVDTLVGTPLAITKDHDDYWPLMLGVQILGGSASARLFHVLRNKRSLTYDARSMLAGFDSGYPGMFVARAIFPNDVFMAGRSALLDEVRRFGARGVTKSEVDRRKIELIGRYTVGLASTAGSAEALFQNARDGRPVSFVDDYVTRVADISHRDVQRAIREHIPGERLVCAAAGAVDQNGSALP